MIENKESFSNFIKNEILDYKWSDKELSILFYAFLRANHVYRDGKYIIKTTLKSKESKFTEMFLKFYNLKVEPKKTKTLLKYEIYDSNFLKKFTEDVGNILVENIEENKAYVAGIFIAKGWVSSISSRFYHLEIRVKDLPFSLDIQEAIDSLGIRTITIKKNNWYYTYIKKSTDISNLIRAMNAFESLLHFENIRIERDFLATYKKMESIESYNSQKSKLNSQKQIDAINKIKNSSKIKLLNDSKLKLMDLRLKNPNYSLNEIQMAYNDIYNLNISKSTINNWFNEIIDLAK